MKLFNRKPTGGFMDEIRCDEPSYLIWKWHPKGSVTGNNNRENAIRWGSSLRVKDGEVAVFVYEQKDGTMHRCETGTSAGSQWRPLLFYSDGRTYTAAFWYIANFRLNIGLCT